MRYLVKVLVLFISLFIFISCSSDSSSNIKKADKCENIECKTGQSCNKNTGSCFCNDESEELDESNNCVNKCKDIECGLEQTCNQDTGACFCDDIDKKLDENNTCICKKENQIIDENNNCKDKEVILPVIEEVKAVETDYNFFTDKPNPKYTFSSNKSGELKLSGDCEIENKPEVKLGENEIIFDELASGLYDNCELWIVDEDNKESNHLKLTTFSVFNILGVEQVKGRADGKGVDYVIIGDGFQKHEMALFREKADEFIEHILNYDPILSKQQGAWNIHLIDLVSKESGGDYSGGTPELVNTGLDSYFNCYDIPRLLCVNQSKVNFIVNKVVPQFDKVLVIVNSETYGGAGGDYATASINYMGKEVAIHELGHSFAGLGDEYVYGKTDIPTTEPWEVNLTINNNHETVKWKHWLHKDHVDIFEGGGYLEYGVFRPTLTSLMKDLGQPFYEINLEGWSLSLYRMAGTYFSKTPEAETLSLSTDINHDFEVELSIGTEIQKVTWFVNDIEQTNLAEDTTSFSYGKDAVEDYQIKVVITDKSRAILSDEEKVSEGIIIWNVTIE